MPRFWSLEYISLVPSFPTQPLPYHSSHWGTLWLSRTTEHSPGSLSCWLRPAWLHWSVNLALLKPCPSLFLLASPLLILLLYSLLQCIFAECFSCPNHLLVYLRAVSCPLISGILICEFNYRVFPCRTLTDPSLYHLLLSITSQTSPYDVQPST